MKHYQKKGFTHFLKHYLQLWMMMIVCLSDMCLKKMETKKSPEYLLETLFLGGLDGTRTRDPMRDRHVF